MNKELIKIQIKQALFQDKQFFAIRYDMVHYCQVKYEMILDVNDPTLYYRLLILIITPIFAFLVLKSRL